MVPTQENVARGGTEPSDFTPILREAGVGDGTDTEKGGVKMAWKTGQEAHACEAK